MTNQIIMLTTVADNYFQKILIQWLMGIVHVILLLFSLFCMYKEDKNRQRDAGEQLEEIERA